MVYENGEECKVCNEFVCHALLSILSETTFRDEISELQRKCPMVCKIIPSDFIIYNNQ